MQGTKRRVGQREFERLLRQDGWKKNNKRLRDLDLRDIDFHALSPSARFRLSYMYKCHPKLGGWIWPRHIIPAKGKEIIGYKKAIILGPGRTFHSAVVTLRIPPEAKRTGCYHSAKCRAEFADVIRIEKITDAKLIKTRGKAISLYCSAERVAYKTGTRVFPDAYVGGPRIECTNGIHFFLNKEYAINY